MLQLELNERKAKIVSVTPNRELHGQDPKPYCALKLRVLLTVDDLAMFHPDLRSVIYQKTQREGADLADQGTDAQVRFPQITLPIKWKDEIIGAEVTVHYGATEKSHIKLPGCSVTKPELEPLDGGVIFMECSVTAHPDEKQMGRLGMMVGTEIPVSIKPPEPDDAQGSLEE